MGADQHHCRKRKIAADDAIKRERERNGNHCSQRAGEPRNIADSGTGHEEQYGFLVKVIHSSANHCLLVSLASLAERLGREVALRTGAFIARAWRSW